YVDRRAHKTIYEGAQFAAAHGATVKRFRHDDLDDLERLLNENGKSPRLICVDGVNSMTGNAADIEAMARLARAHDALLYVDEERGHAIRAGLWQNTATVLQCLDPLGAHTPNNSGFPIIEVPLGHGEDIDAVGSFLFENGIYVTLAAYPLVPRSEVGFRIQITAANTDAEIERLVDVLGTLANRFDLQPSTRAERAA